MVLPTVTSLVLYSGAIPILEGVDSCLEPVGVEQDVVAEGHASRAENSGIGGRRFVQSLRSGQSASECPGWTVHALESGLKGSLSGKRP